MDGKHAAAGEACVHNRFVLRTDIRHMHTSDSVVSMQVQRRFYVSNKVVGIWLMAFQWLGMDRPRIVR